MEVYAARQPIFDRQMNVYGYELLYRKSTKNVYEGVDDNKSTAELINNVFLTMYSKDLVRKTKVFINFSEEMLIYQIPKLLPKESTVIEILERVEVSEELINACRELAESGYIIALDDFIFDEKYLPLLEIAHIVKVEYPAVTIENQKQLINRYKGKIKFLAEKIETRQEYQQAISLGYDFFQGYFFSKPLVLQDKEIGVLNGNLVKMMEILNGDNPEYDEIAKIVEMDLDLSYKILKLSSSLYYGLKTKIIKNALVQIGFSELKKWVYVQLLKDVQVIENRELIKNCYVRARFMGILAVELGKGNKQSEFFMAGVFSSIDILLNRYMETVMKELALPDEVKTALTGGDNNIRKALYIVIYYEMLRWDDLDEASACHKISSDRLRDIYIDSLKWAVNLDY
jgi:EAL and modified HD-GYP domain-containing signal transduction protein